jgi:hypothetical protein
LLILFAAGLAAAAVVADAAVDALREPPRSSAQDPMHLLRSVPARTPDEVIADRLRDDANRAYEAGRWAEVLERLDEALKHDVAGDLDPVVVAMRRDAEDALRRKEQEKAPRDDRRPR